MIKNYLKGCVTVQAIRNITNFSCKNSYEFVRICANFVLKFVHEIREKFLNEFACEFAHEFVHEFMYEYYISKERIWEKYQCQ